MQGKNLMQSYSLKILRKQSTLQAQDVKRHREMEKWLSYRILISLHFWFFPWRTISSTIGYILPPVDQGWPFKNSQLWGQLLKIFPGNFNELKTYSKGMLIIYSLYVQNFQGLWILQVIRILSLDILWKDNWKIT